VSKTVFQAPAILTRLSYTKDGGLSLGFSTNELTDEEKVIASRFHQKFGYILFKENQFKEEDIPDSDASDESKSPSQRLRAVLFVLWNKRPEPKGDFEGFYRQRMEMAINKVKKLIELETGEI
jgi:hypothetical protein